MEFNEENNMEKELNTSIVALDNEIAKLSTELNEVLDDLSKNELYRAVKFTINFPSPIQVSSEKEETFIKTLTRLRAAQEHCNLMIYALKQIKGENNGN